jgi:hypothetical protein
MKLNKTQIRHLIAEERAKLVTEQLGGGESLLGEMPSDLETGMAMALQEHFEEVIGAETYQGTGPGWKQEISSAGFEYHQAIIDSGALKMLLELFTDVEERLHNGDYA